MMQDLFCDLRECHPFKLARPVGAGSAKVRCTRWINVKEQLQPFSGEKKCEQLLSPPFTHLLGPSVICALYRRLFQNKQLTWLTGAREGKNINFECISQYSEWVLSPFVNHNSRLLPLKPKHLWDKAGCMKYSLACLLLECICENRFGTSCLLTGVLPYTPNLGGCWIVLHKFKVRNEGALTRKLFTNAPIGR